MILALQHVYLATTVGRIYILMNMSKQSVFNDRGIVICSGEPSCTIICTICNTNHDELAYKFLSIGHTDLNAELTEIAILNIDLFNYFSSVCN